MNLVLPVFLLFASTALFGRLLVAAYDIVDDMRRMPFNPRYLATWMGGLALALSLLTILGWFIWYLGTLIASTLLSP